MKMRTTLFMLSMLVLGTSYGQRPSSDMLNAEKGPITIQPISHAIIVFTWDNKTIYTDPTGGAAPFEGLARPDIILVTDIHGDHFNAETLAAIKVPTTTIIAPQAVIDLMPAELKAQSKALANGTTINEKGVEITGIPMYNIPEDADSMHTKGRGNGYVLNLGGKRIYISGDTEDIPEMRSLQNIDVAFICMNLPFTMDINQASSAVLDFKPKIVYPYHYRGQDTEAFKKLVDAGSQPIEVRLKNWYPN